MEYLIKDGKKFNLETSKLVAVSQWYTYYETKRHLLYQTAKGVFFKVEQHAKRISDIHSYVVLKDGSKVGMGSVTVGSFSITDGHNGYRMDVAVEKEFVSKILSEEDARDMFEHIGSGKGYGYNHRDTFQYKLLFSYAEIFSLEEM
jgi:hypothetical protein